MPRGTRTCALDTASSTSSDRRWDGRVRLRPSRDAASPRREPRSPRHRERVRRARAGEASSRRQGRDIVHLEIGEPDFETPAHVAEAGVRGDPRRVRRTTARRRGCRSCARRPRRTSRARAAWTSTPGACSSAPARKPFLFFTVLATCGPGDEVIYPDPGFPIYESAIRFVGRDARAAAAARGARLQLRSGRARGALTPRTRLVILNSPHNPTGGVIPRGRPGGSPSGVARDTGAGSCPTRSTPASPTTPSAVDRVAAGDARAHGARSTGSRRRSR